MKNTILAIGLFTLFGLYGCTKSEHKQVPNHEPLSEDEYQSVLDMDIRNNRPLDQDKLIYRNDIHYYNINSISGPEIYREIKANGLDSTNCTKCSWAYKWEFVWYWDTVEEGGLCSVKWINSGVNFDYYLPLLTKENQTSSSFQEYYSTWTKDVWTAINTRSVIVLQEAALVERKVMAFPKQNCEQLDNLIKTEGSLATARIYSKTGAISSDTSIEWMKDY